jgi:hypothetical protein
MTETQKKAEVTFPNMLLIGSSGRQTGKTRLATTIINKNREKTEIFGLKVTTIEEKDGTCPHGRKGCGVCSSMEGDFLVLEEKEGSLEKDTSLLLSAGAKKVFWLLVLEDALDLGAVELLKHIPQKTVIVAESNRLRLAVKPGLFIMLINRDDEIKPSAERVRSQADLTIVSDGKNFDFPIDTIRFSPQGWVFSSPNQNKK